jgi:putative heme-binding domain-containing protein
MSIRSRSLPALVVSVVLALLVAAPRLSRAADAAQPALVPIDLALNKTASASSFQDDGRSALRAFDGDPNTRWCASGPDAPQWLAVDLQKPEELTGCRLLWEKDQTPYGYKVEGSADGKNWQLLVDETAAALRTQSQGHKFAAQDTRYVKLSIVGLTAGAWASLFEFEVLGRELVKPTTPPRPTQGLLAGIKAPAGFEVTLFAAPPDVNYPTCLSAGPTGELYVGVDMNGSLDAKPERGSVVRCIDEDGDGRADKFNVFAQMDSPRGVHFDAGTLYVLHPPRLTAFHDENGDGVSDRADVLVDGIGYDLKFRGADHTTNGFRLGIDGWLYIAVGDYGFVKATGKDGQSLQLHGGGVVRVRTDGSGLETVSRGQRNIYDVAVDPLLNAFTRDNTNDGGGWDVRLSHVVSGGQYGYPSLFTNFPDEIIQPLADYGGGSPCGSLFVDEAALPEPFARGLYTCEWGRSIVYRHPLMPHGAGFTAGQEVFLEIPRPTDMDVDGQGRLYVSSWRDGGFNYSGPNVGYVAQVRALSSPLEQFPDLKAAGEADLLRYLTSASHVRRLAVQREMLRRAESSAASTAPALAAALEQICTSDADVAVKVAAIFTLKQLRGAAASEALVRLAARDDLREFALRALADNKTQLDGMPLAPFVAALADANPRVRLQAVTALGRLGKPETSAAIVPLLADSDPLVAHLAVDTLVKLRAAEPCLQALDAGRTPVVPGCVRVLQALHEPAVVDGLIERLGRTKDSVTHQGILKALCRLYYREAEWNGDWWSTRPDTSGPYYNRVKWEKTAQIGTALAAALAEADAEVARGLLVDMAQNKIESAPGMLLLLKLAAGDAALSRAAVRMLETGAAVPDEAAPVLLAVAAADDQPIPSRAAALRILARIADRPVGLETAARAFGSIGKHPNNDLLQIREAFARDAARGAQVDYFAKLVDQGDSAEREAGCFVLVYLAGNAGVPQTARDAALRAIDGGWQQPATAAALLRAIGRARAESFALLVRGHLQDPTEEVRREAEFAASQMRLDQDANSSGPKIAALKFEDVLDEAIKQPGDAARGAQLFARQGCVSCHTVSQNEALKGPLLAGIAARYSRKELTESILKPSAKIAQGFETQFFVLDSGKLIDGFVVRESGDEIEVRGANGQTTIVAKSSIDERGKRETSVMPTGLVDPLSPQDLASLLAYLESLKAK